jgi:hypothetical protein
MKGLTAICRSGPLNAEITDIYRKVSHKIISTSAPFPNYNSALKFRATHQHLAHQFIHRLAIAAVRIFIMWHAHMMRFPLRTDNAYVFLKLVRNQRQEGVAAQ